HGRRPARPRRRTARPGPGRPKKVEQAPQPLRQPQPRPLRLRLLGGLIVAVTTLYCSPARRTGKGRGREGAGLYPELAAFGISEGATPALASRVARTSALLPS